MKKQKQIKKQKRKEVRMSTKVKVNQATDLWELHELLSDVVNNDQFIERRPRTSRKEGDWEGINTEEELWNLERFNYRAGEAPPLRLDGDEVMCEDGESISVEYAKRIIKDAHRAWATKKRIDGGDLEVDGYTYTIYGDENGRVRVGCKTYDRKEVEAFIRKVGWTSRAKANGGKKKAPKKAKKGAARG